MLGSLVIAYLFLGGAAGGTFFVISAWSIAHFSIPRPERLTHDFKNLQRYTYLSAFILLVTSLVCLLWDLGQPSRAFLIFLLPHPTPLTFGAYSLLILALFGGALAIIHLFDFQTLHRHTYIILEICCCIASLAVICYTAVYLMSSQIALWKPPELIGLFLFSSLSSGFAITMLASYVLRSETLEIQTIKPLQTLHVICLISEVIFLVFYIMNVLSNSAASGSIALLTDPGMLSFMGIGVVVFGMVFPITAESYSLFMRDYRSIPASDAACLIGGLILRYVIISCGIL